MNGRWVALEPIASGKRVVPGRNAVWVEDGDQLFAVTRTLYVAAVDAEEALTYGRSNLMGGSWTATPHPEKLPPATGEDTGLTEVAGIPVVVDPGMPPDTYRIVGRQGDRNWRLCEKLSQGAPVRCTDPSHVDHIHVPGTGRWLYTSDPRISPGAEGAVGNKKGDTR